MEPVIANYNNQPTTNENFQQKINYQQRKIHLLAVVTFLSACATLCYKYWFKSTPLAGPIATAALSVITLYHRNVLKQMEASYSPENAQEQPNKITDIPPSLPPKEELPDRKSGNTEESSDSDSEISDRFDDSKTKKVDDSETENKPSQESDCSSNSELDLIDTKAYYEEMTITLDEYEFLIMGDIVKISMEEAIKKYDYENLKKCVAEPLRDKIAEALVEKLKKYIPSATGEEHEVSVVSFILNLSFQFNKVFCVDDTRISDRWDNLLREIPEIDKNTRKRILSTFRMNYLYHHIDAFIEKNETYLQMRKFCKMGNIIGCEDEFPSNVRPHLILGYIDEKNHPSGSEKELEIIEYDNHSLQVKEVHYKAAAYTKMEMSEIFSKHKEDFIQTVEAAKFRIIFKDKALAWVQDPNQEPQGTVVEKIRKFPELIIKGILLPETVLHTGKTIKDALKNG